MNVQPMPINCWAKSPEVLNANQYFLPFVDEWIRHAVGGVVVDLLVAVGLLITPVIFN